jgi:hypothetical protein
MAAVYVEAVGSYDILKKVINGKRLIDRLDAAFATPMEDRETSLATAERATGFGFCDMIGMSGDLLFCSALKYRAADQLSVMHGGLGSREEADRYKETAERIAVNVPKVFYDQGGLLKASTKSSCQPDVWGSAFSVYIGMLDEEQSKRVGQALADAYTAETLACKGNIRHVLTSDDASGATAWDSTTVTINTYQNGAYWGTPTGWVCYAIAKADKPLAKQLAKDYIDELREGDFRKGPQFGSPWEYFYPKNRKQNSVYMTSVTCPLGAFKRLGWVPE